MADTTTLRPTRSEDEFFAREDAEKRRRLALAVKRDTDAAERERLRALHHMRCPKCGLELQEVAFRGVQADVCFACGGLFLDRGEVDHLGAPERKGVLDGLLEFLK
jgi:uncharacterized protein